jgi:DNA-binding NtrC family response regulator
MAEILVVDDDHDIADTLADVIGMQGHDVRVAYSGLEGLRALDRHLPDLVVLDVEMPALDGPGMAYRMFADDLGREQIPVLLASGVLDLASVAARVGTPYFIGKPCSLSALMSALERALAERRPPLPSSGSSA